MHDRRTSESSVSFVSSVSKTEATFWTLLSNNQAANHHHHPPWSDGALSMMMVDCYPSSAPRSRTRLARIQFRYHLPSMGLTNKDAWRSLCHSLQNIVYTNQKDEVSSSVGAHTIKKIKRTTRSCPNQSSTPIRTWRSSLSAAATSRLAVLCAILYRDPRCGR